MPPFGYNSTITFWPPPIRPPIWKTDQCCIATVKALQHQWNDQRLQCWPRNPAADTAKLSNGGKARWYRLLVTCSRGSTKFKVNGHSSDVTMKSCPIFIVSRELFSSVSWPTGREKKSVDLRKFRAPTVWNPHTNQRSVCRNLPSPAFFRRGVTNANLKHVETWPCNRVRIKFEAYYGSSIAQSVQPVQLSLFFYYEIGPLIVNS